jgi:tRNA nucleotidyltransferase (CCA-adding enzyme)
VRIGDCRVDVAIARAERYPSPGALPEVWPAPMEDDLARRDFTVNAIAVDLVDGTTRAAPRALEDLRDGVLRVLHDRSFLDDPTRLWRLARYRARLGFAIDDHTLELAREAVKAGALDTVSGTRIGNELRLALGEPDPVATLQAVAELELAPWLDPDRTRIERALEILPEEGDRALTVLAAAAREPLPELGFTAPEVRAADKARALRSAPVPGASPSEAARAFDGAPVEAIAATGTPEAERWLRTDRHRRLAITGDDLLAAGIPAGPELGRRLRAAREALLDGRVGDDAEAQLQVALASPG